MVGTHHQCVIPSLRFNGYVYGVIDNNTFLGGTQSVVYAPSDGDLSFSQPLSLGTAKAMYLEDNKIFGMGNDMFGGGRIVIRKNEIRNTIIGSHGTETGGRYRSVRSFEIYNNTFVHESLSWTAMFIRGGTGVIFNNVTDGVGEQTGYSNMVKLINYRTSEPRAYGFGMCDGTNPYDGNIEANGYPCFDQIGRGEGDLMAEWDAINTVTGRKSWPRQKLEPLYVWGNDHRPVKWNTGLLVSVDSPTVIKENREYYIGRCMPGYSPYTYPHPLRYEPQQVINMNCPAR